MSKTTRNGQTTRPGQRDHDNFQLSPEWTTEIKRRIEQIDRGEAVLIDADTAFAQIQTNLAHSRRQ